ncbi:MAG: Npt1/Npt2 family nucleotide transporter [Candidatus Dependentiae bacterium]
MKNIDKKFILFGMSYFLLFCAYTIAQVIKESIFANTVGVYYINYARLGSIFILIPFVLFYSYLIDNLEKKHLTIAMFTTYGILQFLCSLFLMHPTIGLSNTNSNAWRLFGWLFFFLVECFAPFMLSVFWAYVNSTSSPEQAKKRYSTIITFGTLGGLISSALSWFFFSGQTHAMHTAHMHTLISASSSFLIIGSAYIIYYLNKTMPDKLLASYAERIGENQAEKPQKESIFSGAKLTITTPYIFGIFSIVFFYEVTSMIITFLKLYAVQYRSTNISQASALLFQVTTMTQLVAFLFSLFGTRNLMRKLGERSCLLLIPILITISFLYMVLAKFSFISIIIGFMLIRALNYSFIRPIKEALYIPTDIQTRYKAKSWIDTIGTKLAKGTGSACNIALASLTGSGLLLGFSALFSIIAFGWIVVSVFLGNRYRDIIRNKEIVGN